MKCDDDEKVARQAAQKEAQKKMQEKALLDKEKRLKELEKEKEEAMLRAAKGKK